MPLRFAGLNRKRWRYVGVFGEEAMACAARVQIGPIGQTFWAIWDREEEKLWERTSTRLPGGRGEVWTQTEDTGAVDFVAAGHWTMRIEGRHLEGGAVRGFVRGGAGSWAECVCANHDGGYVWTRKRISPVECDLRIGDRRIEMNARAIEDESAGYHPRHTVWSWSAGVGTLTDGRDVGWNLVEGVNDPPERSERAIWVAGEPTEPGPVEFDALDAVRFDTGERLEFSAEAERSASEDRRIVRYSYRQPFGSFHGRLPGGLELREGLGVMERQDALW